MPFFSAGHSEVIYGSQKDEQYRSHFRNSLGGFFRDLTGMKVVKCRGYFSRAIDSLRLSIGLNKAQNIYLQFHTKTCNKYCYYIYTSTVNCPIRELVLYHVTSQYITQLLCIAQYSIPASLSLLVILPFSFSSSPTPSLDPLLLFFSSSFLPPLPSSSSFLPPCPLLSSFFFLLFPSSSSSLLLFFSSSSYSLPSFLPLSFTLAPSLAASFLFPLFDLSFFVKQELSLG